VECVILAAGLSRRLGMDKALIDVGSQPLISWISRRLSSRVANITIVANESNFTEISKTVTNVNVILNRNPHKGRTGSLKVGIDSIDSSGAEDYRLLVVPVDRPGFSDSTLERLICSQETCCPMKEGKGGHPLVLTFEDVDKVRKSSANSPLREIINASRFEVLDRFLDLNIDTPADIINLKDKLKSINE
jgi:molybdenum cofactor cytidylyltransferase|tara:strand:+ start:75 stop:644 length:570 start_codon:yes stop_codon:yes gene_type:complete